MDWGDEHQPFDGVCDLLILSQSIQLMFLLGAEPILGYPRVLQQGPFCASEGHDGALPNGEISRPDSPTFGLALYIYTRIMWSSWSWNTPSIGPGMLLFEIEALSPLPSGVLCCAVTHHLGISRVGRAVSRHARYLSICLIE